MIRKDILLDQIEQAGRVLAKVLADFLCTNAAGLVETGVCVAVDQLKAEISLPFLPLILRTDNSIC